MSGPKISMPVIDTIELAVEIINREAHVYRFASINEAKVKVAAAMAIMVEGGNPVGAETAMLLGALEQIETARMVRCATVANRWASVAGVLLPMVRDTLTQALAIEHARPTV